METMHVAKQYFEAWNRHDAAAIVAAFAEDGTYSDPTTGQPLTGQAIGNYASSLWNTFPDLSFEMLSAVPTGDGEIVTRWIMHGTHQGSRQGLPSTGRSITLLGADFIRVEGNKIHTVEGYFDSAALRQLDFQVIEPAHDADTFRSSLVADRRTKSGAVSSLTRDDQDVEQLRIYGPHIAALFAGTRT